MLWMGKEFFVRFVNMSVVIFSLLVSSAIAQPLYPNRGGGLFQNRQQDVGAGYSAPFRSSSQGFFDDRDWETYGGDRQGSSVGQKQSLSMVKPQERPINPAEYEMGVGDYVTLKIWGKTNLE